MENSRLNKKMNGLKLREIDCEHPIDNFQFIEFIDNEGNLNVAFSLYYFKNAYYNLSNKKFFKPFKITQCTKLSKYVKTETDFISINMAEYYKVQYAEEFLTKTQWYKEFLEKFNTQQNNI